MTFDIFVYTITENTTSWELYPYLFTLCEYLGLLEQLTWLI